MRWDREKLPHPNLHVYGKNGTKIMVYNVRRCPKKRGIGKPREKRLRNTTLEEEFWILDYITQATPRMIFISYTFNFSSKPPVIVTSILKSG